MKQKGFTLIELLAVIIILGIISLIVFPSINSTIKKQRAKLYDRQVVTIEQSAESWAAVNTNRLPNEGDNTLYVPLDTLVSNGFLKNDDIKDPRSGNVMYGCVGISYDIDNKQYTYEYINSSADDYNNECNVDI